MIRCSTDPRPDPSTSRALGVRVALLPALALVVLVSPGRAWAEGPEPAKTVAELEGKSFVMTNQFLAGKRVLDTATGEKAPFMADVALGRTPGQVWKLTPVQGGYYRLTTQLLGEERALDTYANGKNAPAMLPTGKYSGQLWKLTPYGTNCFRLSNKFLGEERALDTDGGTFVPVMRDKGNKTGQCWIITPVEPVAPARTVAELEGRRFTMTNRFREGKQVLGTTTKPALSMLDAATRRSAGHLWKLSSLPGGHYRLTSELLGEERALDTYANGKNAPAMLPTGKYSGQLWKLTPYGDGCFRLTNKFLGEERALDTDGGTFVPVMRDTGNKTGQCWIITPVD